MYEWGVWYSAVGYVLEGWLAQDGNHGRGADLRFDTEAEAAEVAQQEEAADPETAFFAAKRGTEDKADWRVRWNSARARVRARMRRRLDEQERHER